MLLIGFPPSSRLGVSSFCIGGRAAPGTVRKIGIRALSGLTNFGGRVMGFTKRKQTCCRRCCCRRCGGCHIRMHTCRVGTAGTGSTLTGVFRRCHRCDPHFPDSGLHLQAVQHILEDVPRCSVLRSDYNQYGFINHQVVGIPNSQRLTFGRLFLKVAGGKARTAGLPRRIRVKHLRLLHIRDVQAYRHSSTAKSAFIFLRTSVSNWAGFPQRTITAKILSL